MSLPKTFTSGERLFATDLNSNFSHLQTGLDNAGPEFTTAGSNTVNVAFDKDRVITRTATGTVTFTGSSYNGGRSASIRIVPGAANRSLVFPAGWVFASQKPTIVPANKTGILALTSYGTTEANVVAAWTEQP
jgi:hypothetical protein